MLGFVGGRRWGCGSVCLALLFLFVVWAALVRPLLIEISNYYWWMRP
jgi:hypothetical protein